MAQTDVDTEKLDRYLELLEQHDKLMGGVAIAQGGKLVYEKYIGYVALETGTKNSAQTKFRIGSISKTFTATLIFSFIEEGKLSLDSKLATFYPQIQNADAITIGDMLAHRSGIHSFTDDAEYQEYRTAPTTKEAIVELIANLEADFKPGEGSAYSNSNYVLLGYIIEDLTGMPYSEVLQQRIAAKLNLSDTYFGGAIDTKAQEAASYLFMEGTWTLQEETDLSIPHGAGAIVSTPRDLLVFVKALFNHELVSEKSLARMKEAEGDYGKGLMPFPFGSKTAYGHDGGIDGFVSNLAYFPDEDLAVALTANGVNYTFNDILIGIGSISFGMPFVLPDFDAAAIELPADELHKYAGAFTSHDLPLAISLRVEGSQLYGQATGQSSFPLTPYSSTEFRFEQAGIVIRFTQDGAGNVLHNSFVLQQAGQEYAYARK